MLKILYCLLQLYVTSKMYYVSHVSKNHNKKYFYSVMHVLKNQVYNDSVGWGEISSYLAAEETWCRRIADDNMHWRMLKSKGA
jgi:hypothetical protein